MITVAELEDCVNIGNKLAVSMDGRKGRCVRALNDISSGELIDRAMTWEISTTDLPFVDRTRGFDYYFVRPLDGVSGGIRHMVFGIISLLNHSYEPNTEVRWGDGPTGTFVDLVAIRNIAAGEELCHWYMNIDEYSDKSNFL